MPVRRHMIDPLTPEEMAVLDGIAAKVIDHLATEPS